MSPRKLMKTFEPGHGFTKKDWDEVSDNPAWTKADFAKAKPFAEAFPDLALSAKKEIAKRARGKQKAPTKLAMTIRLDRDVVDAFKAQGEGWQGRINAALRKAAKLGDKSAA